MDESEKVDKNVLQGLFDNGVSLYILGVVNGNRNSI